MTVPPPAFQAPVALQSGASHPRLRTGIGAWSPGLLFQPGRQESALPCCIPCPASPLAEKKKKITTFSGCHLFILLDSELAEMSFDG